jgi:hypothetical protein
MGLKNEPFKKIFGVLKAAAPTLLTAFGGPAGGIVAGVARKVLGTADDLPDDELAEQIAVAAGSTEGLAKLRAIELELKRIESAEKIDLAKITEAAAEGEHRDRADARARQVALRDNGPFWVLVITTVGFYGALAWMLVKGLPPNGGEVLLIMIGSLGSAWGASVQYFVGSSSGSKSKTDMLAAKKE